MNCIVTQICGGNGVKHCVHPGGSGFSPFQIYLQIYVLWDRWRILAPSSSIIQSLP